MPSRTFQTWQREPLSHRLLHAASGHQDSFEKLLGIKNCVCVCVSLVKKIPTWYFFMLRLKKHGLRAVQEYRVRLDFILMPAYVSIPFPSSVSQMLPTGRAQMQRQIGDLRERPRHWAGVPLSLNVSKCLPSVSSLSPLTQQPRIPKYQWSFPNGVLCLRCYIFVCLGFFFSDRESKEFALKWNRIEFIPNCLKWHG